MRASTHDRMQPPSTFGERDSLLVNPEPIKEIKRQRKEDRVQVGDELCMRPAEAAKRNFLRDRLEKKRSNVHHSRIDATKSLCH